MECIFWSVVVPTTREGRRERPPHRCCTHPFSLPPEASCPSRIDARPCVDTLGRASQHSTPPKLPALGPWKSCAGRRWSTEHLPPSTKDVTVNPIGFRSPCNPMPRPYRRSRQVWWLRSISSISSGELCNRAARLPGALQISSLAVLVGVAIGTELFGVIRALLALLVAAAIPAIEPIWRGPVPPTPTPAPGRNDEPAAPAQDLPGSRPHQGVGERGAHTCRQPPRDGLGANRPRAVRRAIRSIGQL